MFFNMTLRLKVLIVEKFFVKVYLRTFQEVFQSSVVCKLGY